MTTLYVRHPDLRLTEVADEGVVLHLGSRQYFSLNETGVLILNALEQPRSIGELITAVTDVYDVTPELAETTARAFLTQCCDAGLVRAEEG
jgi:hypothetical protein